MATTTTAKAIDDDDFGSNDAARGGKIFPKLLCPSARLQRVWQARRDRGALRPSFGLDLLLDVACSELILYLEREGRSLRLHVPCLSFHEAKAHLTRRAKRGTQLFVATLFYFFLGGGRH